MEIFHNILMGFSVAMTLKNLSYCLLGSVIGTLVGVLPGLGPVATIAMLMPLCYGLDATTAIIMLAGIYYGAQYGGSTAAILVNIPGETSSIVTTFDGHQMALQGRAAEALRVAALGSFFAGQHSRCSRSILALRNTSLSWYCL
jgi:putative tricarboxylic transport membrane protein